MLIQFIIFYPIFCPFCHQISVAVPPVFSKVKNLGPWGISGVQPFQGGVPGGGATGAARQSQWDHHLDQCKIMYNNEYIMNI